MLGGTVLRFDGPQARGIVHLPRVVGRREQVAHGVGRPDDGCSRCSHSRVMVTQSIGLPTSALARRHSGALALARSL
jgi:hypothetical protein